MYRILQVKIQETIEIIKVFRGFKRVEEGLRRHKKCIISKASDLKEKGLNSEELSLISRVKIKQNKI